MKLVLSFLGRVRSARPPLRRTSQRSMNQFISTWSGGPIVRFWMNQNFILMRRPENWW